MQGLSSHACLAVLSSRFAGAVICVLWRAAMEEWRANELCASTFFPCFLLGALHSRRLVVVDAHVKSLARIHTGGRTKKLKSEVFGCCKNNGGGFCNNNSTVGAPISLLLFPNLDSIPFPSNHKLAKFDPPCKHES